jgi:hypothetical protein
MWITSGWPRLAKYLPISAVVSDMAILRQHCSEVRRGTQTTHTAMIAVHTERVAVASTLAVQSVDIASWNRGRRL